LLQPDPTAVAPVGQTQPYPLTQIEYALVPAAPLADATGACRTDSQALLTKWLTYVTTDGQQNLPKGLSPLPDALKAQAAAAIAQVGATPGATPCTTPAGTPATTVPPSGDASSTGSGSAGFGTSAGSFAGSPARSGASSSATVTPATTPAGAKTELAASTSDIPDYGGVRLPSSVVAMLSVIGLVVLMSLAAKITASSGKRGTSSG
jgi:hypothetical protein